MTGMRAPHEGVMVRLAPSPIAGIGVFAIQPIAEGTNLFAGDSLPIRWVREEELGSLSDAQRAFYDDFAIRRGDELGCPANFNLLTAGWYCNEPAAGDAPNARMSDDFQIIAACDIAAGEEVTIDYSSFSR